METDRRGFLMKKVYLISSGEYSDYGIVAVFANEADADAVAEVHNKDRRYDKYRIEEYDLYEAPVEPILVYWKQEAPYASKDGPAGRIESGSDLAWPWDDGDLFLSHERAKAYPMNDRIRVSGTDKDEVEALFDRLCAEKSHD